MFRGLKPLPFFFKKRILVEIRRENVLASKHFRLYNKKRNICGECEYEYHKVRCGEYPRNEKRTSVRRKKVRSFKNRVGYKGKMPDLRKGYDGAARKTWKEYQICYYWIKGIVFLVLYNLHKFFVSDVNYLIIHLKNGKKMCIIKIE